MVKVTKQKKEWLEVELGEDFDIRTTDLGEIHITHGRNRTLDQMIITKAEARQLANGLDAILNG